MDYANLSVDKASAPLAMTEEDHLKYLAKTNNLIFVGTVVEVGKKPKDWSGYANAFQRVKYKISRIIRGQYGASEINIQHIVVYGSKTAQAGEDPGLSETLFVPNRELVIFAKKTDSGLWKDTDEQLGAAPANEEWIRKVEAVP